MCQEHIESNVLRRTSKISSEVNRLGSLKLETRTLNKIRYWESLKDPVYVELKLFYCAGESLTHVILLNRDESISQVTALHDNQKLLLGLNRGNNRGIKKLADLKHVTLQRQ